MILPRRKLQENNHHRNGDTVELELRGGKRAIIDADMYEPLRKYQEEKRIGKWFMGKGSKTDYSYAQQNMPTKQKSTPLHQVIMIIAGILKPGPGKYEIDHIDGNGLNNTRNNLRWTTHSENLLNLHHQRRKDCSSQYIGVYYIKRLNKWGANITVKGKRETIGFFDTEIQAAKAYDNRKIELTQETYGLNIPNTKTFEQLTPREILQ